MGAAAAAMLPIDERIDALRAAEREADVTARRAVTGNARDGAAVGRVASAVAFAAVLSVRLEVDACPRALGKVADAGERTQ